MRLRNATGRILVSISLAVALAQASIAAQNADDLAKQTQNPVSSLISLPFQGNWDFGLGPREASGTTLNVQPVAPFPLTERWNVILRVIMPLLSQPASDGLRLNGLGDTTATIFLSPAKTGRIIWAAGPVLLVPTATSSDLGTEQLGLGPSAVALAQPGPWTVGFLFNHLWSVDGAIDRDDVNQTFLQPFVNYNLGDGIAVGASLEASAAWDADETWTAPLVFTASKVTTLGKRPVNFVLGGGPLLASPSGSAEWRLRLQAVFLFPR